MSKNTALKSELTPSSENNTDCHDDEILIKPQATKKMASVDPKIESGKVELEAETQAETQAEAEADAEADAEAQVEPKGETKRREKQKMREFPVYFINSDWKLMDIDTFLSNYEEISYLRLMYNRTGSESPNGNIVILSFASYQKLCNDGYHQRNSDKFVITPYKLRPNNFPGEGHSQTLFVPIPTGDEAVSDDEVRKILESKLEHLVGCSILPETCGWEINIPLKSRETGELKGVCFIHFTNTPIECIAMARILIADTTWNDKSLVKCFWARAKTPKQGKVGQTLKAPSSRAPKATTASNDAKAAPEKTKVSPEEKMRAKNKVWIQKVVNDTAPSTEKPKLSKMSQPKMTK